MTSTLKLTPTGRVIDVARPRAADIELLDEAWALAQINRFTGCALRPYSVDEHSLLVAEILEREFGMPAIVRFAGLHHDGHESITGDVATPDKVALGAAWDLYEAGWADAVRERWGLADTFARYAGPIKRADLIALATERRDLMPPVQPDPFDAVLSGIEPVGWLRLNSPERRACDWEFWRDRFMDEHFALVEAMRP